MELTVMQEGKLYFDANGFPRQYPKFVPEDYVILELAPRHQNGEWVRWNQELPKDVPEAETWRRVQSFESRIQGRFEVL